MMWWRRIAELLPPEKRGRGLEGKGAGFCSQCAEGFLRVFSKFLQILAFVPT